MTFMGCRFSNTDYAYCILSGTRAAPVVEKTNRVLFPKGYSDPELLQWLYQELSAIFDQTKCKAVGIKKAEGNVQRSNSLETRIQGDAIAMLAAAQAGCIAVHRKMNSTIAKDLGLKGRGKYLKTKLDTTPIDGFDTYPLKIQEAVLVAWSCI